MSDRRRFASRFPSVARLLASAGIGTAPEAEAPEAPAGDEGDEDAAAAGAGKPGAKGKTVSQDALAAAFEADGEKLVAAERTRWDTVLQHDAGKANIGTARRLLAKTDMSAEDIIESIEEDGGSSASGKARERERSIDRGRDRLRGDRGLDRDTGGAGGAERTAGKGDELEDRRARRREMQERRNDRSVGGGRGARRDARNDRDDDRRSGTR